RGADHSRACGRADERELRQIKAQTARLRPLVDDDVKPVIFHRRIKIFFNGWLEPMDLVDEKHIAFFQTGEKPGQLAGFFDHGSAGIFDVYVHRVGDDVSKRGFAEAGWSTQQNMLEHVAAPL